jgi:hypothetical protein
MLGEIFFKVNVAGSRFTQNSVFLESIIHFQIENIRLHIGFLFKVKFILQ